MIDPRALKRIATIFLWAMLFWTALVPILALQWWLNALPMRIHPSLPRFLGIVFSIYFSFALLTPVLFVIVRRWPIKKPWVAWRLVSYVAGAAIFVLLVPAIRCIVLPPWDMYAQHFVPRNLGTFYALLTSRFADYITAYMMIVAVGHAFELHERARNHEIAQSDLQRTLAESELQMLKTQLHPHFLFNTLQGISTLTEEDPGLAKEMISALGDLLRAALKHSSMDVVSLNTEMEFVSSYLELEKMRLGDRLQVRINISRAARECSVPQLLLQPLVENAIVHGIANNRSGGWVEITSEVNDEQLRLRIANSVASRATPGTGLGLRNAESRLKLLYAEDATLTFRLTSAGTAETLIVIPALKGIALRYSMA